MNLVQLECQCCKSVVVIGIEKLPETEHMLKCPFCGTEFLSKEDLDQFVANKVETEPGD